MVQFSSSLRYTRITLFILNVLFFLFGISVMSLGIYIKSSDSFSAISQIYNISAVLGGESMQWIGLGMIIAGILTACLAAFGCLGVVLQNRCLLYVHSIFLILIIIFELTAVIVVLVFRNNLWKTYHTGFQQIFHDAYSQNKTNAIKAIENLEYEFKCCGVDGISDYLDFGYTIPKSCYPNQLPIFHPYYKGCADIVVTWIWNELPIIAGVLGGILFFEIFGIIFSLILGVSISHRLKPY